MRMEHRLAHGVPWLSNKQSKVTTAVSSAPLLAQKRTPSKELTSIASQTDNSICQNCEHLNQTIKSLEEIVLTMKMQHAEEIKKLQEEIQTMELKEASIVENFQKMNTDFKLQYNTLRTQLVESENNRTLLDENISMERNRNVVLQNENKLLRQNKENSVPSNQSNKDIEALRAEMDIFKKDVLEIIQQRPPKSTWISSSSSRSSSSSTSSPSKIHNQSLSKSKSKSKRAQGLYEVGNKYHRYIIIEFQEV